jgi:hypothetical protein
MRALAWDPEQALVEPPRLDEANAVAVQIPWLATVETLLHGYWGKIEVLGRDAERAATLIDDFLAAKPEETPEGDA